MATRLTLSLPCPVNRLWRQGRGRTYKSKEAKEKEKVILAEILDQLGGKPDTYTALLDTLEKAGVYNNDRQVVSIVARRLPIPQYPGRLEVTVDEIAIDP
jgi:Holliday junction resolvase RusA-like endonuclease